MLKPTIVKPPSIYWNSFKMLHNDLEESLRYVNPSAEHFKVYSLRFYELLIRASTEFESVCKERVAELKLSKSKSKDFTIKEYYLLNKHFENKLAKVSVGYLFPEPLFVNPLEQWKKSHQLDWYKSYNNVKHNRVANFHEANLENVLKSIGAFFIILDAFDICPPGGFSFLQSKNVNERIKSNEKWPLVLKKEYWKE